MKKMPQKIIYNLFNKTINQKLKLIKKILKIINNQELHLMLEINGV